MTIQNDLLQQLQERNARVEQLKAWETSVTRRTLIGGMTYVVAATLLWTLGSPLFWAQALLPAVGYLLSTLSLPMIRRRWMRKHFPR